MSIVSSIYFRIGLVLLIGGSMIIWGPSYSLDAKLYYSDHIASQLFLTLSAEQNRHYLFNQLADLCFIVSYTWLICGFIKKRGRISARWGMVPGFFDFFETSLIIFYLINGVSSGVLPGMGFITAAKWLSGAVLALSWPFIRSKNQLKVQTD